MWYFSSPFVVFGDEALSHLEQLTGARALIVTDATLAKLGIAARIEAAFHKAGIETRVFAEVEPEPSLQTAQRGAQVAIEFAPDWIVGLGGGSPMDASKAIWAMYEHPGLDATEINPMVTLGLSKAKLIAIPTTSGTGSEATWALVLTDAEEKRKFSTGSRELVPTLAIIDPTLTQGLPARITADTGLDALTHAIEGYVATWHNDFSDGLCLKATQLVFDYLARAVRDGNDLEAREHMGNAATIAGLGFGNANLGLAHAMGHSFGSLFKQPHGRAVALYLPYTIDFTTNAVMGRYADIARFVGFTDGRDEAEGGRLLAEKVRELARAVQQPMRIADFGIDRADFREMLPKLVEYAEQDTQFFTAPRIPESEELAQMFEYVYEGKPIDF
ncbi:MAG: iron-containing alcohol dehydrogenase [Caldilineaceae bacterium]|jgi:alcohol dehydrogenase class IV|nr:iron-containing alcohol dehydrogenase [Caldilineaceae bacterium]